MIVKNENLNFIFYYLITFMFIKIVFFFLISFSKLKISENHVLRKMTQTLKNFTLTVDHEESAFKTFFITFAKLLLLHKLKNIFFLNAFSSLIAFNFSH